MNLKISKQLNNTSRKKVSSDGKGFDVGYMTKNIKRSLLQPSASDPGLGWNYLLIFFLFPLVREADLSFRTP